MLREIISITGKPGLFKLLSQGKNALIVEELGTGRRFPATARDRVVSLGDIAMYTESGDTPLGEILDKVYAKHEGKPIEVKALVSKPGALKDAFADVVDDFDRVRVHDGDIKKLFTWYNLLIANGFDKFTKEEEKEAESAETTEPETKQEVKTEDKKETADKSKKAKTEKESKPKAVPKKKTAKAAPKTEK